MFYQRLICTAAFVIACFVSFRSLWTSNREQRSASYRKQEAEKMRILEMARQNPSGGSSDGSVKSKWKKFHDDLLTTFADLEGTTHQDESFLQLQPHLATMDLDFSIFGKSPSIGSVSDDGKFMRQDSATQS